VRRASRPRCRSHREGPHLCGPSVVELPGIEPASLPGSMPSELQAHSVSVRFSTGRYLRFGSRTLTASRAITNRPTRHLFLWCSRTRCTLVVWELPARGVEVVLDLPRLIQALAFARTTDTLDELSFAIEVRPRVRLEAPHLRLVFVVVVLAPRPGPRLI
jgi:hypothetical protein